MLQTIISTIITFVISGTLGYCVNAMKNYKNQIEKNKNNEYIQNMALKSLLKSNLTNIYFVYSELKEIPDYAYENFLDMLAVYENLGGNGFIHTLADKMKSWKITKTDVLK